jgi:NAD(P)H-dependent flavin oxidoreductase YrpB (nitropropane dioxygenase family)
MPRKYVREYSENPRASWIEETLRQAIARINAGEIGIVKATEERKQSDSKEIRQTFTKTVQIHRC